MTLSFVDRMTYKKRADQDYLAELQAEHPNLYIVPEGGSNQLALLGVGELIKELDQQCQYDVVMTPVGSGGTLAGLINQDNNRHLILGIAVLKHQGYLNDEVNELLGENHQHNRWKILNDWHCGGYAKFTPQHLATIKDFSQKVNIPFEPIYSGKMIIALLSLIEQGYFNRGQQIVLVHTGGLQGLTGLIEQGRINAQDWQMPIAPQDG